MNIFFINGMDNNYKSALASANIISQATNRPIGLIVNNTGGIINDAMEYLPENLYLKDALNGEVFYQIAQNTPDNARNLFIMHSAGNNDVYQAARTLKLNNQSLENKLDFASVGSPISASQIRRALEPVGGNLVGHYNNWKDPVTHAKTWGVGALGLAGAGVVYGTTVGIASTVSGTGLEAFGSGLIGGGIGGGAIVGGIKLQHPFERYYNNNFQDLQTDIKNWAIQNPVR